jgi:hypothetical protein
MVFAAVARIRRSTAASQRSVRLVTDVWLNGASVRLPRDSQPPLANPAAEEHKLRKT